MVTRPKSSARRLAPALAAIAALPAVMAPGRCGFALDYTETILITEKLDRIVLGIDDGSIWATMYDRQATLLKRHTFAFEPSLGEVTTPGEGVEDGVMTLEARCKYEGNCSFDHMFELPLGVALEATMLEALIRIGYFNSDIDLSFTTGSVKGVRLESPNLTITAEVAELTLDFAAPPAAVTIVVQEGEVTIEVPAGEYRCALVASGGAVKNTGVTCNDTAESVLDVQLGAGDITVTGI